MCQGNKKQLCRINCARDWTKEGTQFEGRTDADRPGGSRGERTDLQGREKRCRNLRWWLRSHRWIHEWLSTFKPHLHAILYPSLLPVFNYLCSWGKIAAFFVFFSSSFVFAWPFLVDLYISSPSSVESAYKGRVEYLSRQSTLHVSKR